MSEQQSRLVVHMSAEQSKRNVEALRKELQSLTSSGNQLQVELDKAFKSVNATSQGFNKVGSEAHKATSAIDGHIGAVKQLAAAYISWHGVTKGIQHADSYTGLENRLKLVTNGQLELNKATADTYAIAQKTGQEWQSTATVYQRFAQNAEKLNLTQEHTARLTETVAKAIATSGASAASADAALVQFGQSLASGVFRGEEFNSVAEQTPALLQAIAQGLGVGIGELREMAKDGVLTADVLVKALTNAADNVDANFSKITLQAAQGWTILSNSITRETGALNETYQITSKLVDSARYLSENMDTAAPLALAVAFGFVAKSGTTASIALYDKAKAAIASRQATIAEAQAVVVSHQAVVAETTAIVSRTGAELAFVQAKLQAANAQMIYLSGMQKVAFVERTIIPLKQAEIAATNAHTAALRAETTAQNGLNAAKLTAGRVASTSSAALSGLMGLLGGPAGLIGLVVTLGASFLLMRDNSDEADEALKRQSETVGELTERMDKLNSAQKFKLTVEYDKDIEKAADNIRDAQVELLKLANSYDRLMQGRLGNGDALYAELENLKKGGTEAQEAFERLEKSQKIPQEYLVDIAKTIGLIDEEARKTQDLSNKKDLLEGKTNKVTDAVNQAATANNNLAGAVGNVATQLGHASKGLDEYFGKLNAQMSQDKNELFYLHTGSSEEQAKMYAQAMAANGGEPLTVAQRAQIDESIKLRGAITDLTDATKGNGSKSVTARSKDDLAKLAKDPNVRKMLQIIAYTEGTDARHGYNTLVGGNRINDLSHHPNVVGLRTKDGPSTAFGRYQIVNSTWKRLQKQWGFSDFSASTQDQAAIALMQSRGGLNDVLNGNFGAAINKFGQEWVSLPSSKNKNQGKRSWADVNRMLGSNVDTESYDQQVSEAERKQKVLEQIQYKYADERKKAEIDFNNEISEMRQNLVGKELAQYEAAAKASYNKKLAELDNEKKLTELALEERIYQGEKFLLTRDDQIKREAELERKRIVLDSKLSGQDKMDAISMNLVKEQFDLSEPYRKFIETIKQTDAIKEYHQTVDWLNQAMKEGAIDVGQYQIALANLNSSKPDALKTDFEKNWGSTKQWIDDANDIQARLDQGMAGWLQSSSDALAEFVATGKMNFRDFTVSILQDLAKIAMQKAIAGIAGSLFGYGGASAGVGTTALDSLFATGGAFGQGGVRYFAQGGAFTNSVVDKPTMFKSGGMLGVMGEAGPEAILPLKRTSSGNLGVETSGMGGVGQSVVYVTNHITVESSGDSEKDGASLADGFNKQLISTIDGRFDLKINNELRANGKINNAIKGR